MRWGCVPRAGDMCQMVGTLPPHPGNMQKLSQACGTCLGWCTSQSRIQDTLGVCSTCQGHVPDSGHTAPTSWEHTKAVPGVWHFPGTVHIPVTHPGCVLCAECV